MKHNHILIGVFSLALASVPSTPMAKGSPQANHLHQLNCAAGEVAKFDGAQWICAEDNDTITPGPQGEQGPPGPQGEQGLSGDSLVVGQTCPEGEVATGFDGDGNITCTGEPPPRPSDTKVVFVSSSTHQADLGGIENAHAICQNLANSVGLPGTFRAWISNGSSDPDTTFPRHPGNYVLTNGTIIANNWGNLTDGALDAPISITEKGDEYLGIVWTATDWRGRSCDPVFQPESDCVAYHHCFNWWSQDDHLHVDVGETYTPPSSYWTSNSRPEPCSSYAALYCIEQ